MSYNYTSKIDLIIGPMGSGKTTELIKYIEKYKASKKILTISHCFDVYRNKDINIKTHNGLTEPCMFLNTLTELVDIQKFYESDVIIIDEIQFFEDCCSFLLRKDILSMNKKFILAGLILKYDLSPFENVLNLIPHVDNLIKLSSICCYCDKDAIFTKLVNKNKINLIGTLSDYHPVCRFHYFN